MPFHELLYLNDANDYCSVFTRECDSTGTIVDDQVLIPSVTFTGKDNTITVCNIPECDVVLSCSIDLYLIDTTEATDESVEQCSPSSDCTDCTIEMPSLLHDPPDRNTDKFLRDLATALENHGTVLRTYRGYIGKGLFRFDFEGTGKEVCASVVLFRKLATEISETYDFIPCFDIPENYDLPYCRLVFTVSHEDFGDEETIKDRLSLTHAEVIEEHHDYIHEETFLTDVAVQNGKVIDSRYLATENPSKTLHKLLQYMRPPQPREMAESKH